MKWPEVTAVFGGTFDPPHVGHRIAVAGLFEQPQVARVVIVPAGLPALKQARTLADQRWAMAKLAFTTDSTKNPRFGGPVELNDLELRRAAANPSAPSYTYDTLLELGRTFPNLAFVVGTDQLPDLERWHRFPELLGLCHWIVLKRQGSEEALFERCLSRWQAGGLLTPDASVGDRWSIRTVGRDPVVLKLVETRAPDISSSLIRETLQKTGAPPDGVLSPEVLDYLKENGLYGTRISR